MEEWSSLRIIVTCFGGWFILELLFYLYICFVVRPQVNKRHDGAEPKLHMPSYQMEKLISSLKIICAKEVQDDDKSQKTDDEDTVYTIETFLCGWALGSKSVHDIKDGNIYSFLAWAFCSISLDDAKKDLKTMKLLNELYNQLYTAFPIAFSKIEKGHNDELQHARMCLTDVVPTLHRPLFMYCLIYIVESCVQKNYF